MDWDDVRVVVAVAQGGTLSAAARALGVNQTTAARRLAALEAALGATLFTRADGRHVPTPLGEAVAARGTAMAAEADAIARLVAEGGDAAAAGSVRLTATDGIVTHFLVPRLGAFWARWPRIALEIVPGAGTLNLTRREADMALRLNRPQDSGVVARKVADLGWAPYGAAAQGRVGLTERPWVGYDDALAHLPEARWAERARGGAPVILRTPHVVALLEAVAAGHGIGVLPCWMGDADPRLVRLADDPPGRRECWLVIHEALRRQARIRAVADWLTALFDQERARLLG